MRNRLESATKRIEMRLFALLVLLATVGCPPPPPPPHKVGPEPEPVARGAVIYAAYCKGCHGAEGRGDGPVAMTFSLHPADLREPALLAGVSDQEIVNRLLEGTPLRTSTRARHAAAEDLRVSEVAEYIPTLSRQNWDRLRAGRAVYEKTCAPCHGAYGNGEGVLAGTAKRAEKNLQETRAFYKNHELAEVIQKGSGSMPPLIDNIEPAQMGALIAYVRHLSPGYRTYDTYCTGCHGDDGRGGHPERAGLTAEPAPPLNEMTLAKYTPEEQRAKILHMLRRSQSMMPHFRNTLDERQLHDVVAFLRSW